MNINKFKHDSNKAGRGRVILALAAAISLCLACLFFFFYEKNQKSKDEAAFQELARVLARVIRPENPEPARLAETRRLLAEAGTPKGPATAELARGARAFLDEELKEAEDKFAAAALLNPDSPDIYSFQAATHLRLGNTARAEELYIAALAKKSAALYDSILLSADQLGLALCLFLLHRPEEALPLAEEAWQVRRRELGPAAFDSISAANRLATVYVALNRSGEAEALLKQSYLDALNEPEANLPVMEETRLFLQTIAQSGDRAEDMEEFFAAAQVPEGQAGAPPARPGEEPEPISAETLDEWEKTAEALRGYDDALAADLLVRIIVGRQELFGFDLYHPSLEPIHLALVRAYMAAGQLNEAEEELRPLLTRVADRQSEEFLELSILMARIQEEAGRFKDAEAEWLAAAEVLDAQVSALVKTKAGAGPALVARMLELHIQIAENLMKQGKAAAEAEVELRAALGRLNPRLINTYPGTAEIYLRLARLFKNTEKRARDSADYYRRSQSAAQTVLKNKPAPEIKSAMETLLASIAEETGPRRNRKPTPPVEAPVEKSLPKPEMLRHELTALIALDRLAEFQPRIESVLAEAKSRHGEGSGPYLRYLSLKLKSLEEEGKSEELARELLALAEKPIGRTPAEEAINRGSALAYAARVHEKAGRAGEARRLYAEALAALSGLDMEQARNRRRMIEEALNNLQEP